jgi:hypothetical protein
VVRVKHESTRIDASYWDIMGTTGKLAQLESKPSLTYGIGRWVPRDILFFVWVPSHREEQSESSQRKCLNPTEVSGRKSGRGGGVVILVVQILDSGAFFSHYPSFLLLILFILGAPKVSSFNLPILRPSSVNSYFLRTNIQTHQIPRSTVLYEYIANLSLLFPLPALPTLPVAFYTYLLPSTHK